MWEAQYVGWRSAPVGGARRESILVPEGTARFPVDDFPMPSGRDRSIADIERTRRDDDERTRREERERRDERGRQEDETRREETRRHDEGANRFQKLGRWLDVSPERLQNFYQQAKAVNPDLRLSQFFAAFVIANRVNSSNPSVTPQAILRGQESGMSLEQTLVALGLNAEEARAAAKWAERVVNHLKP